MWTSQNATGWGWIFFFVLSRSTFGAFEGKIYCRCKKTFCVQTQNGDLKCVYSFNIAYLNDSAPPDPDKTETPRSISDFWCQFSPSFADFHLELLEWGAWHMDLVCPLSTLTNTLRRIEFSPQDAMLTWLVTEIREQRDSFVSSTW